MQVCIHKARNAVSMLGKCKELIYRKQGDRTKYRDSKVMAYEARRLAHSTDALENIVAS